jgi:AcrR family transcriptional regulator
MPKKKTPRRYHHGDLRRALLDAALAIVEQAGPGALSLRELARTAGVSHAAPYRHFPSREALLVALGVEGFRGLDAEMQAAVGDERDPIHRLVAHGVAYVRYAVAHPGHFKVMFGSELHGGVKDAELATASEPTLRALVDCIAAAQAEGAVRDGDPRALSVGAWATVHGLALLLVDRQLAPLVEEPISVESLARATIDGVVRGLAPAAVPRGRSRAAPKGR